MRSEQGKAGRQTGAEGTLVRDEEGVLVVHNSLLWPTRPNELER